MKIHMRFDESNAQHTRFTIFVNGANTGQLCMTTEEAVEFHTILENGLWTDDTLISSGIVHGSKED